MKWSAVGETRTRTGLLPLPPQSSVSTISPPPLCFGIAKVRQKIKPANFFEHFLKFSTDFFDDKPAPSAAGLQMLLEIKDLFVSLRAFPRVGEV